MSNPDPGPSTRPAPDEIEPGIPATEEAPRNVPPGWEAEEQAPPLDVPQGVEEWGTTPREELLGEPLEVRVRREQRKPSSRGEVAAEGLRLYEPGAEDGLDDDEPDAVGEVDTARDDTLSAEEAAMRIDDDPPGLTDDPSPGYIHE